MINRRSFLRSTASAATIGGVAIMATSSDAAPVIRADLTKLIDTHRDALAAEVRQSNSVSAAEDKAFRDRSDADARQALDVEYDRQSVLMNEERAALVAMLSYPFQNLAELRAVLAAAREAWWKAGIPEEEEFDALFAGIMGEARTNAPS